jgi:RNA polymerase sigma factor (sigma-70 family)
VAAVPSIGRADRGVAPEAELTQALYQRHATQIFRYCQHQLGSREEAEDAVQSTFLNAFRGIKRGIVPDNESAWLFAIAQNVCLSRRRSTWRRGRIESPTDFDVVEELTPAPSRLADELLGLQDVLEQMPESQRRAILLREWQGLSYREIAEELQLSQTAVETLIFRARRSLAKGLEQPPAPAQKRRMVRGADLGNLVTGLKSLFLGGGAAAAKVAAVVAVVSAGTVAAASPAQHHARPPAPPAPAPARVAPVDPTPTVVLPQPAPARRASQPATRVPAPVVQHGTVPAPAIADPVVDATPSPVAVDQPSASAPSSDAAPASSAPPATPPVHQAPPPQVPAAPVTPTAPPDTSGSTDGTASPPATGQGHGNGSGDASPGNSGQSSPGNSGQSQGHGNGNGDSSPGNSGQAPGHDGSSDTPPATVPTPAPPPSSSGDSSPGNSGNGGNGNGNGQGQGQGQSHGGGSGHGH